MRTDRIVAGDRAAQRSRRRLEPWPVGLALLLAFMIGTCIAFYHIASANPDPVIATTPQPGVER